MNGAMETRILRSTGPKCETAADVWHAGALPLVAASIWKAKLAVVN